MEKEGYDVIQFYKGNDALEYIGKEKVDLWVLDIMLGDSISGYDLINGRCIANCPTKSTIVHLSLIDSQNFPQIYCTP